MSGNMKSMLYLEACFKSERNFAGFLDPVEQCEPIHRCTQHSLFQSLCDNSLMNRMFHGILPGTSSRRLSSESSFVYCNDVVILIKLSSIGTCMQIILISWVLSYNLYH